MTMIPTFSCSEHDPLARGRAVGVAWRPQIGASWTGYERLFLASGATPELIRELGAEALERTREWSPALADEITGLAVGSELEPWQLGALNARTELLAAVEATGRGECSTFVALPVDRRQAGQGRDAGDRRDPDGGRDPGERRDPDGAGGPGAGTDPVQATADAATDGAPGADGERVAGGRPPLTIQTWDWHDHLRGGRFGCRLEPRAGHAVRLFTEFGVVGKVGVNSAGLGLHFNILAHAADGGAIGVPVHVVARRILDEARTIDEATAIARSARVSASTVLSVVAYDGERASARGLELSPAGLAELRPDADGLLLHTNHFLDPRLAEGERHGPLDPGSYGRLDELARRAPVVRAAAEPADRAAALVSHREQSPLCCHPEADAPFVERWETLATIVLDVAAGELHVHAGGPCTAAAAEWTTV